MLRFVVALLITLNHTVRTEDDWGRPYTQISKIQTFCEVEAMQLGTLLSDYYNSYDEATEWDMRIHGDFMTEYLGFAGWIQTGTWKSNGKTNEKSDAPALHKASLYALQTHNCITVLIFPGSVVAGQD